MNKYLFAAEVKSPSSGKIEIEGTNGFPRRGEDDMLRGQEEGYEISEIIKNETLRHRKPSLHHNKFSEPY